MVTPSALQRGSNTNSSPSRINKAHGPSNQHKGNCALCCSLVSLVSIRRRRFATKSYKIRIKPATNDNQKATFTIYPVLRFSHKSNSANVQTYSHELLT